MRRPFQNNMIRRLRIPTLFLTAVLGLVYALPLPTPQLKAEKRADQKAEEVNKPIEILRDAAILPAEVDRMRRAILDAATSGDIETMRVPVEMNEIPPIIGKAKPSDPIAHWRKVSGDGEGREILAIFIQLFRTGFSRTEAGTGDEMYIWPYFANMPIDQLTPAQQVELLTLVSVDRFKAMKASGKYDFYRVGIGHDGTWHYFEEEG
jgi:hypothetical protein